MSVKFGNILNLLSLHHTNTEVDNTEEKIKQQIANSSLGQQTTITGFVQGELKFGLLQDADLFVLPSYYENFGKRVLRWRNKKLRKNSLSWRKK